MPTLLDLVALLGLLPIVNSLPLIARAAKLVPTVTGVCIRPSPWTQILSFFITNYVARIATYKKEAGYEGLWDYLDITVSLFVPWLGIDPAVDTIARGSRFLGKTEVDRALLARALTIVIREEGWRPMHGETVRGCLIYPGRRKRNGGSARRRRSGGREDGADPNWATLILGPAGLESIDKSKYKVHGFYRLPDTYSLAHLPPGTELKSLEASNAKKGDIVLSNSYSFVKGFTGLVQVISSLYALFSVYGDQTRLYGFAAFGFTVLPYTVMSILNVIANYVEASYDCLFLVRSDVMKEAEKREGGEFVGEVAELVLATDPEQVQNVGSLAMNLLFRRETRTRYRAREVDDLGNIIPNRKEWKIFIPPHDGSYIRADDPRTKIVVQPVGDCYQYNLENAIKVTRFRHWVQMIMKTLAMIVPYIVIGALSKFKPGGSSVQQQLFMVGWLVVGQVIGAFNLIGQITGKQKGKKWLKTKSVVNMVVLTSGFAFAVGGFVEVGRMLREFGYCIQTGSAEIA
ncbi:hypothetical protein FPQ18DRAFT_293454 [Pyronema domesticum]|nr:hypothetical protein FPQ18DRAFT_293454 [Pyronema domesticum]